MNSDQLFFMIEKPGVALDLVKASIAERIAVKNEILEFIKKIGAETCCIYHDGTVGGFKFKGTPPAGWKAKNSKGDSYPRKDSGIQKEINALPRYTITSYYIAEKLGIPLQIIWNDKDGKLCGFQCIGYPFNECGFAYPCEDGPYLLWLPDVAESVNKAASDGIHSGEIDQSLIDFLAEFPGCRQIDREEWEFIVAKHNMEKKRGSA